MTTTHQILRGKLPTVIGSCAVTLAMVGGLNAATAATSHTPVKACANKKTGELRLAKTCHHNEKRVTWAAQGPRGARGARGPAGPTTDISPPKLTQRGVFDLQGYGTSGSTVAGDISFPLALSAAPIVDEQPNGQTDSHCTGNPGAPTAAPGYLCIYERQDGNDRNTGDQGALFIEDPSLLHDGAAPFGALMSYTLTTTGTGYVFGSWAVTAP
jgi:hypothetical protein